MDIRTCSKGANILLASGRTALRKTRLVTVTLPALVNDILAGTVSRSEQIKTVAVLRTRKSLLRRLAQLRPDVVVVGLRPGEDFTPTPAIFARVSSVRVITFSPDGRQITGFQLRPYVTDLTSATPKELVDFIASGAWE